MGLEHLQNLSPIYGNDQINEAFPSVDVENSRIFSNQETPILDAIQSFPFASDLVSPPNKLYINYQYDPRIERSTGSPLHHNNYMGTRMDKIGLIGGGENGIGGLFNRVTNTTQTVDKYSTVFRVINKPTGYDSAINQIFFTGNIKNYGVGYPNKVDIYNTFASKQNVSLNRYFEQGASDPNISHGSWFVGGPQLDTLGGDTYPSFNPLTHGFTAYNNSTAGGQGRSITVDASQVTSNQLKDTSWETFYNEDHTSKGVGYSYGPNVSSDNLNLRYVPGGLHHPGWRNKFDGTPEPFIIAPIGDRKGEKTGAQGLKNTTWSNEFQGGYALEDASRLTKFYYETTAGAAHLVKQNILGLNTGGPKGGQRYQQVFYTGLSQILNAGGRFFGGRMYSNSQMGKGLADRTMPFNYIPLGLKGFGKGKDLNWYGKYEDGRDPGKPIVTEYPAKIGTSVNDDYLKSKGGKNSATTKPDTGRQQGMPMWFYDLRSGKYLTFRAYLEGLTENVSPNWNNDTYIGRSEPTYVYERTERDISFTLKLFNEIDGRIKVMYQKLGHLTSLCYPEYLKDTYLGNNKTRMKPPLVRMRMGELYGSDKNKGLLGFIKSISYAYPDESPWNLEVDDNSSIGNARVPQYVTAAITFQVIHDQLPNKSLPFNGIEELMGVANR